MSHGRATVKRSTVHAPARARSERFRPSLGGAGVVGAADFGTYQRLLSGYAPYALHVAIVLTAFLAIRLSEVVPALRFIRPVLLSSVIGSLYLWQRTSASIVRATISNRTTIALAAYAAAAVIGAPFALYRATAVGGLMDFAFGMLLTISILMVPPTYEALRRFTFWTVLIAELVSLGWIAKGGSGDARLTSAGAYDPNDLAAMMCLFLPLAIGMSIRGKAWQRLVGLAGIMVFSAIIVLTSSRGGLVGMAVGVTTFVLLLRPSRVLVAVPLVSVLMVGSWQFAPETFRTRAATLFAVEDDYNVTTETGRIAIWKRGAKHFTSHPITGVGLGNYSVAEGNFFEEQNKVAAYFTAHNAYIQAFVEFGLLGGIPFMFLLAYSVSGAWRAAVFKRNGVPYLMRRPEYFAAILAYLTAAFFLSHAYIYLMFAVFGLGPLVRAVTLAEPRARA
jgi:O-antigen ligase